MNPRRFVARILQFIASTYFRKTGKLPTYGEWLTENIAERVHSYPYAKTEIRFSILTTVYEKTDLIFLQETAQSLLSQSYSFYEWLILAHGPVSEDVNKFLIFLEEKSNIHVYRLPVNLGIIGGMRFCLERAKGDYLVPMDADDLLTLDALQVMASVISRSDEPAILYSDEDMLINGVFTSPYFRPDWDSVLNLASSYIWHLCVFQREIAIELQVYSDIGSNWCHDWDTIFRFSNAGYIPFHVSEVLYHWRHHPASSTNRMDPDSGSMNSTRYLLEQQIALQSNPGNYEVEAFPIYRGTQEWYIKRLPVEGLSMDIILLASNISNSLRTLHSIFLNTTYPFRSIIVCINEKPNDKLKVEFERCIKKTIHKANAVSNINIDIQFNTNNALSGIKVAASKVTSSLILFCSDAIEIKNENWCWEALKLIEFENKIAIVGGRLLKNNIIVDGGRVIEENGQCNCPDRRQHADAPGYFSLSLKPHTVNSVPMDFFVSKREFFAHVLKLIPDDLHLSQISKWLGAEALKQNLKVGFSPLISGSINSAGLNEVRKYKECVAENQKFLHLYGDLVKNQKWSSSRLIRFEKVCHLT